MCHYDCLMKWLSADNLSLINPEGIYGHDPFHYSEWKTHCAYSIVLRICRDLEEIWPRLPEALRLWARIPAKSWKNEKKNSKLFFIFLHINTFYIMGTRCYTTECGLVFNSYVFRQLCMAQKTKMKEMWWNTRTFFLY